MDCLWVLVIVYFRATFSEGFLPVNPGVAIGIKSHSENGVRYVGHHQKESVVRLHPSLTSSIEDRPSSAKRKAKQTNFQDLKASLLKG